MRMRWMAGMVGASALVAATAASVAQRPSDPAGAIRPEPNRWKSSDKVADKVEIRPTDEPVASRPADGEARDPMEAFESFLRRNRQEADESIRSLTEEAEALRARLAKVEAALGRWQAVAGSLQVEAREAGARREAAPSPSPTSPEEPASPNLEPISSPSPGGSPSALDPAPAPPDAPQPKS